MLLRQAQDEGKATAMLREELRKQPRLSIFFTSEPWMQDFVPCLVEAGYLGPARAMETAAGSVTVNDVADKARVELLGSN